MSKPDIKMFLERIHHTDEPSSFQLWACRGEGRGCRRNSFRTHKKHCEDCVLARDDETIQQLMTRIQRADA